MTNSPSVFQVVSSWIISEVSGEEFCRKRGVKGLVRIPEQQFPYTLEVGSLYAHFHLNNDFYENGEQYYVVLIFSRDGDEPLLIEGAGYCAICEEFDTGLAIDSLDDFRHTPPHLDSQEKVREWIRARYLHRSSYDNVDALLRGSGGVSKMILRRLEKNM